MILPYPVPSQEDALGRGGSRTYRRTRKSGGPFLPRHTRKAGRSWSIGTVDPKAPWFTRQSWDTRGSWGAREASWALDTRDTVHHRIHSHAGQ